jgi:cytochrome c553
MKAFVEKAVLFVCGVAAVGLLAGAISMAVPQRAQATPQYAKETGLACGRCHENPSGGGPLKAFGKKFQANGHKLPK